jgi:hypothetical protein
LAVFIQISKREHFLTSAWLCLSIREMWLLNNTYKHPRERNEGKSKKVKGKSAAKSILIKSGFRLTFSLCLFTFALSYPVRFRFD